MKFSAPPAIQNLILIGQPYAPHLFAIGIFILIGFTIGIIRINVSAEAPEQTEKWVLPSLTPTQIPSMSPDQITAAFWTEQPREIKKKAEAEPPKKPVGQWRFIGTVDQGEALVAVIEVENGKIRRMKSGDDLPDGSNIKQISETEIAFERQGAIQTIRLFVEKKAE